MEFLFFNLMATNLKAQCLKGHEAYVQIANNPSILIATTSLQI